VEKSISFIYKDNWMVDIHTIHTNKSLAADELYWKTGISINNVTCLKQ